MEWEQRSIKLCAGMLLFAVMLRFVAGGGLIPIGQALEDPDAASFLIYLQTGRIVRQMPQTTPPPATTAPETVPQERISFRAEDAALVTLDDTCGRRPDVAALLTEPLSLDLTGEGPKVLILHTHTTESFAQTADRYQETSAYRTLDGNHNMLALGDLVA